MNLNISSRFSRVLPSWRSALAITFAAVLAAAPASAQVAKSGVSKPVIGGGLHIGNDIGYDPVHKVYLVVSAYGVVRGAFTSLAGDLLAPQFQFGSATGGDNAYASYPRVQYVQDLNGGQGGFLVAWVQNSQVRAVVIAYPSGVVIGEQILGGGASGTTPAIAYSATSRRFLVAWHALDFGILATALDVNGTPVAPPIPLASPSTAQKPGPSLAWNASTNEFGLTYASWSGSAAFVVFQRLRGSDGVPAAGAAIFGQSNAAYCPEVDVNTATGTYIVGWTRQAGAGAMTVQLNAAGAVIAGPTLISGRFGTYAGFDLAFNPSTGTLVAVAEDNGGTTMDIAAELNGAGTPLGSAVLITDGIRSGSFSPRVAARTDAGEWNISFSMDYAAIGNQIATSGGGGGGGGGGNPPPPPPPPANQRKDITVYRPSAGMWYSLTASSNWTAWDGGVRWGLLGDLPLQGDFDADGRPDLVAYRPSTGAWDVLFSSTGYSTAQMISYSWGAPGDVPVPADYTGDGRTDLAIWRPSSGDWYIYDLARQTFNRYQWGIGTDVPVPGDYDRDGRVDVAVFRPSTGVWYLTYSSNQSWGSLQWGASTDLPVQADFSGDGRTEIAVYRPATGAWYVADLATGATTAYTWGDASFHPAPRDYDGDGRADLAIWRPSTGMWYIYFVGSATFGAYQFGAANDIPMPWSRWR